MSDRIMAAAQAWADAREDGTHIEAMRALDTLQRTIADEIAAAVAAERARCAGEVVAQMNEQSLRCDGIAALQRAHDAITTPPAPTPEPATEARVCGYFIDLAGGGIGYNCERTEPCGEHGEFGCPLRHAAPVDEARELGNGIRSVTLTDDGRAIVHKTGAMGHTVIAATPADEAGEDDGDARSAWFAFADRLKEYGRWVAKGYDPMGDDYDDVLRFASRAIHARVEGAARARELAPEGQDG